jgi:hypothetical protein
MLQDKPTTVGNSIPFRPLHILETIKSQGKICLLKQEGARVQFVG